MKTELSRFISKSNPLKAEERSFEESAKNQGPEGQKKSGNSSRKLKSFLGANMAKKIVSLSMEPATQEKLKVCSKKVGKSVSQLVEDLIGQGLHALDLDENGTPKMLLDLAPETQELLNVASKKSGIPVSKIVSDLVVKYMELVVRTKDNTPIILYIPSHLKGNQEQLRAWLDARVNGIVKTLG
jgi:predicted DNA-binding protein